MRTCAGCKREFVPSSNHKKCPVCRGKARKKPCRNGCGNLTAYGECLACFKPTGKKNCRDCSPRRTSKGYLLVYVGKERSGTSSQYVMEHRIVMEEELGRSLLTTESVHHKNGQRDDNRIENLELWEGSQPSGQRVTDKVEWATELLRTYAPERLGPFVQR